MLRVSLPSLLAAPQSDFTLSLQPLPDCRVGVQVGAPARIHVGSEGQDIETDHLSPPSLTRLLHSGKVCVCLSLGDSQSVPFSPGDSRAAECFLRASGPTAGSLLCPRAPCALSLSTAGLLCGSLPLSLDRRALEGEFVGVGRTFPQTESQPSTSFCLAR